MVKFASSLAGRAASVSRAPWQQEGVGDAGINEENLVRAIKLERALILGPEGKWLTQETQIYYQTVAKWGKIDVSLAMRALAVLRR
jgi:hypothetical protein